MASSKSLDKQLEAILSGYTEEVMGVVDNVTDKERHKVVSRVKRAIDNAGIKGTGAYKRSVTSSFKKDRVYSISIIYVRAPHYRLTHLLENGHIIRNAHGVYGRVKAYPHWAPAEKESEEPFIKSVIEAVENI